MFKCSVVSTQEEIDAGQGLWEMTLRSYEDPVQAKGKKYSWGIPATNERVASHFTASLPFPYHFSQLTKDKGIFFRDPPSYRQSPRGHLERVLGIFWPQAATSHR
jgi:hypothetical protein